MCDAISLILLAAIIMSGPASAGYVMEQRDGHVAALSQLCKGNISMPVQVASNPNLELNLGRSERLAQWVTDSCTFHGEVIDATLQMF